MNRWRPLRTAGFRWDVDQTWTKLGARVSGRLYGGPMASVKQFQVTFDCAEPERVARFWCELLGYVVPPPRRGLLLGTISIARCRLSIRVQRSHALIPQVWARGCSSSAFPKARSLRTGCILTCGSAPGSWVKSAWPHLRPNAHDWSRSARYACDYCLPMATTSSVSTEWPRTCPRLVHGRCTKGVL